MNNIEIDALVGGFHNHTLPKADWTHKAHLIVGLHAVLHHGLDASIPVMRDGIKSYNIAVGTPNTDSGGYHETITIFYLYALDSFLKRHTTTDFYALVVLLADSKLMDQALLLEFYERDRVFSVAARHVWQAPTLRPFSDL